MNVLFWGLLLSLTVVLGAIISLTIYIRSTYTDALKKVSANKQQEALDILTRVIGWQQKHVPALWQISQLNLSMDKTEAAAKHLQKIIAIMSKEPDKAAAEQRWEVTEAQVMSKLAWSLSKLNKRPEAIQAFRRLVELDPKSKEARFELAKHLYNSRAYDESIPMYESVIEMEPTHAEALESLSYALSARGDHARAAEILDRRLKNDRENVNLWIRLANLHRTSENNAKQKESWKVVTEITPDHDPNHISALVQLGKLSYLEKDFEESVNTLRAAGDLCPRDDARTLKSVKYYLGRSFLELNRRNEALAAFSEVYELDRNYKDIRDLLRGSLERLSDDDLAEELKSMPMSDFSSLSTSIVKELGFRPTSVEGVNGVDVKIEAKLEETGKDRPAMLFFERSSTSEVGDLAVRNFTIECDEKHVEHPIFLTTGGFSFEAQLRAKDYHVKLMPKREFCDIIRKVRSAA